MPLKQRLQIALAVYAEAGLPALVRITPFTQPASLDDWLADQGWTRHDDTRVMVCPAIPRITPTPLPTGTQWERLDGAAHAQAIGQLRDTPPGQIEAHVQRRALGPLVGERDVVRGAFGVDDGATRRAVPADARVPPRHAPPGVLAECGQFVRGGVHAQRLAASPVPYQGFAIRRSSDGAVLACGQLAREAELVGLYDIHTQAGTRRQGFAITLCERLLALSTHEGATIAYLQVEAGNEPARRLYHRLGFADAYAYHYRQAP